MGPFNNIMNTPQQASSLPDVVVIDTCVLISNVLRFLLLHMARQGCFRPAWSAVIGDEWRRNAARLWGISAIDIGTQWEALQQLFPDADQGDIVAYKADLHRSDPKDWHVIAAARAVKERHRDLSVAVLTRNVRDFNRTELRGLGLALFDPDQFLLRCWMRWPDLLMGLLGKLQTDFEDAGKVADSVDTILKRERLFRLNRLRSIAEAAQREGAAAGAGVSVS